MCVSNHGQCEWSGYIWGENRLPIFVSFKQNTTLQYISNNFYIHSQSVTTKEREGARMDEEIDEGRDEGEEMEGM